MPSAGRAGKLMLRPCLRQAGKLMLRQAQHDIPLLPPTIRWRIGKRFEKTVQEKNITEWSTIIAKISIRGNRLVGKIVVANKTNTKYYYFVSGCHYPHSNS